MKWFVIYTIFIFASDSLAGKGGSEARFSCIGNKGTYYSLFIIILLYLFCFVLFCFVLFCFVLFCFVLFCFVLFCFVLFCFVLFCFVLFCFVLFCFVLFCFVLFVNLCNSLLWRSYKNTASWLNWQRLTMCWWPSRCTSDGTGMLLYSSFHLLFLLLHN